MCGESADGVRGTGYGGRGTADGVRATGYIEATSSGGDHRLVAALSLAAAVHPSTTAK
jgi:hypothetical protein